MVAAGGCRRETRVAAAAPGSDGATAKATAVDAAPAPAAAAAPPRRHRRIDVHTHIGPDGIPRAVRLMNEWGIDGVVNLSGMYPGPPRGMLETQLAAAATGGGRIAVFMTPNFKLVRAGKGYGEAMAAQLTEGQRLGARGLKITKGLGLGYPAPDGKRLLAVDDPGLNPMFERAGALGMPVAIHIGDPKAFWRPVSPDNERWDELRVHPRSEEHT